MADESPPQAVHDKQRLATSGANFARSRTVTDGTCSFPNNWVGCENAAESGNVKYLSEDIAGECEGTPAGAICGSKPAGSFPSFMGV
jgi:photosystem I subunit PsaN